ncbi:MAG: hypothetical protein ACKVS9_17865 [Phycisphaerae bacterium]
MPSMRSWMIRASAFALAAAITVPAYAQWTSDASVNTVVADGSGDQQVPLIKPTTDGGVWVFFYDNGAGTGLKPTMQRLNPDGTRALAGNGVVLANRTNTATFTSDIEVDASGNVYAIFDDNSSGTNRVTVQKVEPSGNLPWGATGVQIPTMAGSFGNRIAVCADGTIVACGAVSNVLQFQRLNADGTFVPGETWSLAEASRGQSPSDLITGGNAGDVILLWVRAEGTNLVTSRKGLKIQKWDATHTPLWNGGVAVDVYTSSAAPSRGIQVAYFPQALPDGSGGAVVSWYDTGATRNAWLQHVQGNGTQRFAQDGLAMSTVPSATELRLSAAATYLPAVDEYVVAFERSNPAQSLYGLGAQRVTAAGSLLWGAGLDLISLTTNLHKSFINVMPAPTDDAVITWLEYTGVNGPMLVNGMRLDDEGGFVWSPTTLGVATTESTKGRLAMSKIAGSDALIATWQDNAAGTVDVKAQRINADGSLGTPPCPADLNNDGSVGLTDLSILLAHFGETGVTPDEGDLNGDTNVTLTDLSILLSVFGTDCP